METIYVYEHGEYDEAVEVITAPTFAECDAQFQSRYSTNDHCYSTCEPGVMARTELIALLSRV